MSGNYNQNANSSFMPRREVRRGTRSATPATAIAASVDAVYAINQDIEYLASAAFDHFDINQIVEGGPLPWDPADMNIYHAQSHSPALPDGEPLPIRSPPASKYIPIKNRRSALLQSCCQVLSLLLGLLQLTIDYHVTLSLQELTLHAASTGRWHFHVRCLRTQSIEDPPWK
jgi:hypothetical protein